MALSKTTVLALVASVLAFGALGIFGAVPAWADSTVVQVMSVTNQASAAAEVERLTAQGVPAFQRGEQVTGIGLRYRVYLGPFDTAQEATGAAEALKGSGLIKEYIVRSESPSASNYSAAPPAATQAQPGQPALPAQPGPVAPVGQAPPSQEYWPPSPGTAPAQTGQAPAPAPSTEEYWPPLPGADPPAPANQNDWPPPPGQPQAAPPAQAATPSQAGQYDPPVLPSVIPQAPGEPVLAPSAQGAIQSQPPVLPPQGTAPPPAPGEPPLAPSAQGASPGQTPVLGPPGVPVLPSQAPAQPPAPGGPPLAPSAQAESVPTVIPGKPVGPMKIQGFEILSDLSSSMRRISACPGGLIKQEAVNTLLRRMNQRIPSQPYMAALRVFGYKQAWTRSDYTTLYYGPAKFDRSTMEGAIGRLFAADSISPFGFALTSSEAELAVMNGPRAVLMFADFEETTDSGAPVDKAKAIRRKYGEDTKIYTFYVTRQSAAERLAADIAKAGGGKDYNVCDVLMSDTSFENMMTEIFGPADLPPCKDSDGDGVCDERDVCPSTPRRAPVDERGCWIAAYSQFFDFDKAEVKSAFQPRLKFAAELIVNNPQMGQITIAGHTDGKGTDAYNMDLGRRRAEAVKELLVKFGAPADRLIVESYGKSRPIDTNDTEEGRAKNRRVEFHVGDVPR